jgi:hypothetical protein
MRAGVSIVLALLALAGCGGGDKGKPANKSSPPPSSAEQALASWAASARAYWQDFGDCGTRAHPRLGFYASCTKRTRTEFHAAGERALARAGACARRKRLVERVRRSLDAAVTGLDRQNDASLTHGKYRGPPVQALYSQATQSLELDVPAARVVRC